MKNRLQYQGACQGWNGRQSNWFCEQLSIFKNWDIIHITQTDPCKVHSSLIFSILTKLGSHHWHLIPEYFHHPQKNPPISISSHSPSLWQPLIYFLSLWSQVDFVDRIFNTLSSIFLCSPILTWIIILPWFLIPFIYLSIYRYVDHSPARKYMPLQLF